MGMSSTIRQFVTAALALAMLLWAEAGLTMVAGDQVMQCSMTMHHALAADRGDDRSCCPGDERSSQRRWVERPPCCSVGSAPERPLGFVSSERVKAHDRGFVAEVATNAAPGMAQTFGIWRNADAPRFVKPILELKTDLRI
jgi:hypothetical protein